MTVITSSYDLTEVNEVLRNIQNQLTDNCDMVKYITFWEGTMITLILLLFFAVRLVSLFISIRNEKRILSQGGRQYGEINSKYLTIMHIAIYFFSFLETLVSTPSFNIVSIIGLSLLIFGYTFLFIVIKQLGPIWTLKLYILKDHKIVTSKLFKTVKHPNYYLSITPELIGVILLTQSYFTALLLIPYGLLLYTRIRQEEDAMAHLFEENEKHLAK